MNKNIKYIIEEAKSLGWNCKVYNNYINLQQFSPAGQDFSIEIEITNAESMAEEIKNRYENFDVSEETYLWLDDTGHGQNGAPYDMKDLYQDIEACQSMLEDLSVAVQNIEFDEED